jgi:hypothetical protein
VSYAAGPINRTRESTLVRIKKYGAICCLRVLHLRSDGTLPTPRYACHCRLHLRCCALYSAL